MNRRLTVPTPTPEKIEKIAENAGFRYTQSELEEVTELISTTLRDYTKLYDMTEPKLPVKYARDFSAIYQPRPEDNKHNAWSMKANIQGAVSGKLEGKKIAIKDNIQIAGVPMKNGSELLKGFVPVEDASVITAILDAGGSINGTTNVEDMCISGSSFTGINGPVCNPWDTTRCAGGSSSGSAVVIVTGEADMAIGCDQGGSIRVPASWCGIVGLKPTHGLVPYTGIACFEPSLDHVGPMTKTVADCALLLEVIAGYDNGLDPRQPCSLVVPKYTSFLSQSKSGRKIAYLKESFVGCHEDVCDVVKSSFRLFEASGIAVEEVSIPLHLDAKAFFSPVDYESAAEVMFRSRGCDYGSKGYKNTAMAEYLHKSAQTHFNNVSHACKYLYLMGAYMTETCGPSYYAKASNMRSVVCKEYDKILKEYDVLLMPTVPFKAPEIPQANIGPKDSVEQALGMFQNTSVFNYTGHPAISVNAGFSDMMPIGVSIIGKHFDEATVLTYAYVLEQSQENTSNKDSKSTA